MVGYWAVSDMWLSELLGQPCFNIRVGECDTSDVSFSNFLRAERAFGTWKVQAQDVYSSLYAQARGFRQVETSLIFKIPIDTLATNKFTFEDVAEATSADEQDVVDIARTAFSVTRFHLDPVLGANAGNDIKAAWVKNFFRGQRGDGMFVARRNGELVGFLLYLVGENGDLTIDLIAVAPHALRQGVGRELISALIGKVNRTVDVLVGTQACNIPSISLYSNLGFKLSRVVNTFHYHAEGWSDCKKDLRELES